MLHTPAHLQQIESVDGMHEIWKRYVPSRLIGTDLKYRKQVWYFRPARWLTDLSHVNASHEREVRVNAAAGGIGVLIYDLSSINDVPDNWLSLITSFVEMHKRLHNCGDYDKWLVRTLIVAPNTIVHTLLSGLLASKLYRPTRPFEILSSLEDMKVYTDTLWLPRR